jgi:hypothetical protein
LEDENSGDLLSTLLLKDAGHVDVSIDKILAQMMDDADEQVSDEHLVVT